MSFVITMYVREGLVMASDSRLTLNTEAVQGEKQVVHTAVAQSDYNYKTFLAPGDIGITTYGAADILGVPVAGHIESFIGEQLAGGETPVDEVPARLLDFFGRFSPPPAIQFHVAGYKKLGKSVDQQVWHVMVQPHTVKRLNPPGQQGAAWGGEADILARLIQPVAVIDAQGGAPQPLPHLPVPWQFFTLQDAIDFSVFAVRSTIDAIRFQPRAKTVGGPIDVLVIKPSGAVWVQRKELRVQ
jgi:hypothetical protein